MTIIQEIASHKLLFENKISAAEKQEIITTVKKFYCHGYLTTQDGWSQPPHLVQGHTHDIWQKIQAFVGKHNVMIELPGSTGPYGRVNGWSFDKCNYTKQQLLKFLQSLQPVYIANSQLKNHESYWYFGDSTVVTLHVYDNTHCFTISQYREVKIIKKIPDKICLEIDAKLRSTSKTYNIFLDIKHQGYADDFLNHQNQIQYNESCYRFLMKYIKNHDKHLGKRCLSIIHAAFVKQSKTMTGDINGDRDQEAMAYLDIDQEQYQEGQYVAVDNTQGFSRQQTMEIHRVIKKFGVIFEQQIYEQQGVFLQLFILQDGSMITLGNSQVILLQKPELDRRPSSPIFSDIYKALHAHGLVAGTIKP